MLLDAVAIFIIVLTIRDITKMFLKQFAPDELFYQPKHRKRVKLVSFFVTKKGGKNNENQMVL